MGEAKVKFNLLGDMLIQTGTAPLAFLGSPPDTLAERVKAFDVRINHAREALAGMYRKQEAERSAPLAHRYALAEPPNEPNPKAFLRYLLGEPSPIAFGTGLGDFRHYKGA